MGSADKVSKVIIQTQPKIPSGRGYRVLAARKVLRDAGEIRRGAGQIGQPTCSWNFSRGCILFPRASAKGFP